VAYLGEVLTDPLTKKQSLITTIMEVFSNIPREAAKRACSCFLSRLEKVVASKGNFIR
jgi:gamma-glutamyl:cysteine ligase YbdK (ATP-grasp superfamily)